MRRSLARRSRSRRRLAVQPRRPQSGSDALAVRTRGERSRPDGNARTRARDRGHDDGPAVLHIRHPGRDRDQHGTAAGTAGDASPVHRSRQLRACTRQHRSLGFSRCRHSRRARRDQEVPPTIPRRSASKGISRNGATSSRRSGSERAPATPFRDGFEATRVVTAIYRSAAEGRAVTPNDVSPQV